MQESREKKSLYAKERDELERGDWFSSISKLIAKDFVFLDECGAWPGLTRSYARAASNKRAAGETVKGKKEKLSLIAAVKAEGLDLNAYTILKDSVDSKAFLAYLEHVLIPTLKRGQLVIMDNYSIHKNKKVRQLIEQAGCYLVYLPTYSPDFNPMTLCRILCLTRSAVRC